MVKHTFYHQVAVYASVQIYSAPRYSACVVRWPDLSMAYPRYTFRGYAESETLSCHELVNVDRWFFVLVVGAGS